MNPTFTYRYRATATSTLAGGIGSGICHPLLPGGGPVTAARPDREYPATPPP
jgi:hypothetical protein